MIHHTTIIDYNSLEQVGKPRSSRLQIYMKIYLYNNCKLNAIHKQTKYSSEKYRLFIHKKEVNYGKQCKLNEKHYLLKVNINQKR